MILRSFKYNCKIDFDNLHISFGGYDQNSYIKLAWMKVEQYNNLSEREKQLLKIVIPDTGPAICLNTLEIFNIKKNAARLIGKNYCTAIVLSTQSNGVKSGFYNPSTNEPLHWMNMCDYVKLSNEEKEEFKQKYYTGNLLRQPENQSKEVYNENK